MNKEELKNARKAAYQKAKKARDADPCYQALKQKFKEKRQALYRAQRDKQKTQKKALLLKKIIAHDQALAEDCGLSAQLKLLSFDKP